jgi:hypothetical protein
VNGRLAILFFSRIVYTFLFECFLSEAITINIVPTNIRIPSINIDQILNRNRLANVTPDKFKDNPIANSILCGNAFTLYKITVCLLHFHYASTNSSLNYLYFTPE